MKFRLIDVRNDIERNVEFGTCELCFSVGDLEKDIFIFENERKERFEIENGFWSWGAYIPLTYIDNVIDFAGWLSKQEVEQEYMDEELLVELSNQYLEEVGEQ